MATLFFQRRESPIEIRVLTRAKHELKIEVAGEGHTFCNILQSALLKDDRVELAGYRIPHPLNSNPVIYIRTKKRTRSNPEKVLRDAVNEVRNQVKSFRDALTKALDDQ
jgi:DNA-directed RNA polymerase subunit L